MRKIVDFVNVLKRQITLVVVTIYRNTSLLALEN